MTKVSWTEHFKNQIKDAKALFAKEPSGESFLHFCLRKKLLASADYLNWARETQQIPVLSQAFFATHPPKIEFFKKYQKTYAWNSSCLPIAEWDGSLIVACLEVPEDYSAQAVFVLTSYENLETAWNQYSPAKAEPAAISLQTTEDEIDMNALSVSLKAPSAATEAFVSEDGELILQHDESDSEEASAEEGSSEESSGEEDESSSSEEESEGIPEGLFGDVAAPPAALNLEFNSIKLTPLTKTAEADSGDTTEIGPDEKTVMRAAVTEEVSEPSIKPLSPPPPQEEEVALSAMHEQLLRKGPRTSRPVVLDTLPSDDVEEDLSSKTQRKILGAVASGEDLPKAPMKMTQGPVVGAAAYFLEKVRKQNQDSFDKDVLACLNYCKTFFKKSMLLAIGDKDRVVKPILWEGGDHDVRKPSMVEFSLKTPSVFRIVSGTQKPYHGYIVANDLNEAFFESWNHGQIPDHVTIVPLMDNDLVVGMLLGMGEKSSYNKSVLQFSENAAKELSQKILKSVAKAA